MALRTERVIDQNRPMRPIIAPADVMAGRDPQLERAVQGAMKLLTAQPAKRVR
jgi:hypothetical protein